jgi:hypothetical protein
MSRTALKVVPRVRGLSTLTMTWLPVMVPLVARQAETWYPLKGSFFNSVVRATRGSPASIKELRIISPLAPEKQSK